MEVTTYLDFCSLIAEAETAAAAQARAGVTLFEARVRKAEAKVTLKIAKNSIVLSLADPEAEREFARNQSLRDARPDEVTAELSTILRAAERDVLAVETEERIASYQSQLIAQKIALAPLMACSELGH